MTPFKVFLSHSTKDGEFVQKVAEALRRDGIDPWLCEVDIIPGDNFVSEIEMGLSTSDLAVVFWSPDAARSPWTEVEWTSVLHREIRESRRRLGVVHLRDAKLPELLQTKIYIDARAHVEAGLNETVKWITRMRDMRRNAGAKAPLVFLDYEPTEFVGRTEHLEILHTALVEKDSVFLLHGELGSGKSTLALKFAWQTQGAFDTVVFQRCGQRGVDAIGMELAEHLGLDVTSLAPEKQIEAIRHFLKGLGEKAPRRSLLILDDIWSSDVKILLPGPPVSVLCTSRQRSFPWVGPNETQDVKSFSLEEAATIFRIYLGDDTATRYRTALIEFAERVERLPIAVVVAADLLRREFGPLNEATRAIKLAELRSEVHDVPGLLKRAVESQPEDEQTLLKAMSACSPDGFWLNLAAHISGVEWKRIRETCNRLVNASLVRMLDRERQLFQFHPLQREQLWASFPIADYLGRHAIAVEELFREWESEWRSCRLCLPEVIQAMDFLWRADAARGEQLAYWGGCHSTQGR